MESLGRVRITDATNNRRLQGTAAIAAVPSGRFRPERFRFYPNRENALSCCFYAIPDGKPVPAFPGIALAPHPHALPPAASVPTAMTADATANRAPGGRLPWTAARSPLIASIGTGAAVFPILGILQFGAVVSVIGQIGERGIELAEYAACRSRYAGDSGSRLHDTCDQRRASQAKHAGQKYPSIHDFLQIAPLRSTEQATAEFVPQAVHETSPARDGARQHSRFLSIS